MYTIGQYKNRVESALTLLFLEWCERNNFSRDYKLCLNRFICEISHTNESMSELPIINGIINTVKHKQDKIIESIPCITPHTILILKEDVPRFWRNIAEIVNSYFSETNEN